MLAVRQVAANLHRRDGQRCPRSPTGVYDTPLTVFPAPPLRLTIGAIGPRQIAHDTPDQNTLRRAERRIVQHQPWFTFPTFCVAPLRGRLLMMLDAHAVAKLVGLHPRRHVNASCPPSLRDDSFHDPNSTGSLVTITN